MTSPKRNAHSNPFSTFQGMVHGNVLDAYEHGLILAVAGMLVRDSDSRGRPLRDQRAGPRYSTWMKKLSFNGTHRAVAR